MSELEALAADEGSDVGLAKEEGSPAEAEDALAEAEGASVVITEGLALALALVSAELDAGPEGAALLSALDATSEAAAEAEAENGGTVGLAEAADEALGAESTEEDGADGGRVDTGSDELGRMLMTEEAALVATLSAVEITLETTAEEGTTSEALVDGKSVINGESEVVEAAGADEGESDALAALEEGKTVIKGAPEEATADAAMEAEAEAESAIELTSLEAAAALPDAKAEAEGATLEIAELAEVGLSTSLKTELTAERSGAAG
jgi:hypothetical protein